MSSEEQAVENFREYLRICTVQPNPDYDGATKFLKRMAVQLDLKCTVHECVAKKPIVIMTWPGSDPELSSLLLNSHTDVVPVYPEFWKHDPFGAVMEENGDIYARGAQDMKCVGIQYLEAIRKLKSSGLKPLRTIHLTFVPDEEIGGVDGMKCFIESQLFKDLNVGFALDEGLASPTEDFLAYYGERCIWWVTIICTGQPGHGSLFLENNAGEKLRKVINSFLDFRDSEEKRLKSEKLTMGEVTTTNLTKIKGGIQTNVVPSEFRATFDVRIPPLLDLQKFEEKIKKWCEAAGPGVSYEFEEKVMIQSLTSTSDDNIWWKTFKETFNEMKLPIKVQVFPGATDSRYLREIGLPAIGFSPMNNTPVLLHDHNERLNKKIFLRGIDIYVTLISRLANVHQA